ncbi:MAG: hypothetical protein KQH53_10885 [Desulfarculaceae bacterium]|nr:hypothetical protein [Desulfarculaceae bacterium]
MRFHLVATTCLSLLSAWLLPGCLVRQAAQAPEAGPLLAGGPVLAGGAAWWPWAVAGGVVLGAALALAVWAWLSRPAPREPGGWWGGGDTGNLKAALRLVEQVIKDSNHRMKVVPFDKWVNERRGKKKKPS